ncbi:MAG: preprotein translocase subunit SecE [Bryobacteraceae bacterium]|nr:preprotein translocase subunit SecE [Bryobacteraceae bacterium]
MKSENLMKRIGGWPVRLKNYIEELQTEMRRVTWPSAKQVRATTLVVIATVFAFAGYFAIVDFFVGRAIGKVFSTFTH